MTHEPYADTIDHLQDEIGRYLPTRAARINAERQLRDANSYSTTDTIVGRKHKVSVGEMERRVKELVEEETSIRREVDARLEATRQAFGEPGIDLDCLNGGLTTEARLVLLALLGTALGMGEVAFSELGVTYFTGVNISDIMVILDAKTIEDRLRVRRLLFDLAAQGLIVLDFRSRLICPEDFNSAGVSLSRRAYCVLLGDPSLETEGIFTDTDSKE